MSTKTEIDAEIEAAFQEALPKSQGIRDLFKEGIAWATTRDLAVVEAVREFFRDSPYAPPENAINEITARIKGDI